LIIWGNNPLRCNSDDKLNESIKIFYQTIVGREPTAEELKLEGLRDVVKCFFHSKSTSAEKLQRRKFTAEERPFVTRSFDAEYEKVMWRQHTGLDCDDLADQIVAGNMRAIIPHILKMSANQKFPIINKMMECVRQENFNPIEQTAFLFIVGKRLTEDERSVLLANVEPELVPYIKILTSDNPIQTYNDLSSGKN